MDSKQLLLGLVAILGIGALAVAGLYFYNPPTEEPVVENGHEEEATPATFNSTELGLMFTYPSTYTLETHEDGSGERAWTTLVLIDSELLRQAVEQGHSEGPPAITVQVFENIESYTIEQWVTGMAHSNFKLSPDEVLAPTTVDGEQALAYRHSGLYEHNAVVTSRGNKIYLFSVGWLTPQDAQVHDFEHLLETVSFY